jgi:hypothetical protein
VGVAAVNTGFTKTHGVTVDRSGSLTLSYTMNNQVPQQKLYEKFKSMLSHLGMHPERLIPRNIYMKIAIPIAG